MYACHFNSLSGAVVAEGMGSALPDVEHVPQSQGMAEALLSLLINSQTLMGLEGR